MRVSTVFTLFSVHKYIVVDDDDEEDVTYALIEDSDCTKIPKLNQKVYSFIAENENDEFFTYLLGICLDKVNDFTCNCQAGYTGRRCDVDINDCVSSPCENGTWTVIV